MGPILSFQPFKGIATIVLIVSALPYFALVSMYYAIKRFRPVPEWSFKNAIGITWLHLFYRYVTAVQLKPFYASPKKLKERYVLVQPGPSKLYNGILINDTIKPASGSAIWFPRSLATIRSEKSGQENPLIVIHFQGGAFVTATDPVETGQLPSRIFEKQLGAITFYAQYRLSRDEKTRFPAALQDAVTFYHYILDQGVDPDNIIISGDSAGGSLVIALLRYIEDHGMLAPPRGAMAWSPWVDISDNAMTKYNNNPRLRTDYLNLSLSRWGKEAYEPSRRTEETSRYLAPMDHPFRTKTPLFVNVGSVELLYDEVKVFADRMTKVEGNRILYLETRGAPHDVIFIASFIGFVREADDAVKRAGEFFGLPRSP